MVWYGEGKALDGGTGRRMACTWDARLKKERQLGGGAFGRAFLVRDSQQSNAQMVLKEIDVCQMPKSEREAAWQEARLLGSLHHPNVVRSYEHFQRQSKLCILMDFCSGGDLEQILKAQNGQLLPESTVLDWFVQIVLGVKHMHDRKILHRDLKTSNCFICSDGSLKVGDMGVSKILNGTQQLAYTAVGTPCAYLAHFLSLIGSHHPSPIAGTPCPRSSARTSLTP